MALQKFRATKSRCDAAAVIGRKDRCLCTAKRSRRIPPVSNGWLGLTRPQNPWPHHHHVLIGRRRVAGGTNEPVRLQENVVVLGLLLGKVADRGKGRAKDQANQHDPAVGAPVGVMK